VLRHGSDCGAEGVALSDLIRTLNEALAELIGSQLSSVEFVQDYAQLRFDGPTLTAYTPADIVNEKTIVRWADPGYRDGLCSLITVQVTGAQVDDKKLEIRFENGSAVEIPLNSEVHSGPEAFMYVDDRSTFVHQYT
jgi:hypothetical protein